MQKLNFARETVHFDWPNFRPGTALRCVPGIVLALAAGLAFHQPTVGILVAGAALNVGFGSFRKIQGSRLLPMLLATAGTSLSAFAGTLWSHSNAAAALLAGFWGFCYGLLVVFGDDISWIALQCGIALLIAGAYPGDLDHAALRGLAVFAGGLLQMLLLLFFWRLQGAAYWRAEVGSIDLRGLPGAVRAELSWRHPESKLTFTAFQYALRVAMTLVLAVLAYRLLPLQNGYWVPLTALLVLKPDFYRTYAGGFARVAGTLAGVTVATLLALFLRPQPFTLVALVALFSWLSYAFQKVNYAVFTGWITSFIVFLVAIVGLPEATVTMHRLIDTLIGSGIAMFSRTLGLTWKAVSEKRAAEHQAAAAGR